MSELTDASTSPASSGSEMLDIGIIGAIGDAKLIPVLRLGSAAEAVSLARRILNSGLPMVEIATTTPGWVEVLASLRTEYPDKTIGAGTILDVIQAQTAVNAGADFLVSPHLSPSIRSVYGRYLIEGGLSPSEVFAAAASGLAKLFPAHVGGPRYLESLRAVYPEARIMPTGGLRLSEASTWISAGAFAVGIGSGLSGVDDPAQAIASALNR